jgi:hypothetical protein
MTDDTRELGELPDGQVEQFVSELRDACLSAPVAVEPGLAHLLAYGAHQSPAARRSPRVRTFAAKIAAAAATALAATGGLAVASALPNPVQSAVSDAAGALGVNLPSPDGPESTDPIDVTEPATATTAPAEATEPVAPTPRSETDDDTAEDDTAGDHPENHGRAVSEVAQDDSLHGCEHGRAVSSVASGRTNDKPCPHTESDDGEDDGTDDGSTPPSTEEPVAAPTANGGSDNRGRGHDDGANSSHGRQRGGHGKDGASR